MKPTRLAYAPSVTTDAGSERIEFDVFISHAWEDKDEFVRPLAHALEARRLRPWYDEFTLRPGDSLRRSIDHGLLTSQVGIIVLSPAFFAKRWTAYELDGLVQLHGGRPEQVAGSEEASRIIPVWHGVDAATVARYSPSLANLVAIISTTGVEPVADRILDVLRPAGSTLLVAHAELSKLGEPQGWHPPIVTDDWWLDAAESSAKNDAEGDWQEAMGWGHWGFPLPDVSSNPRQRGHRLARAAAQMMWQRADDKDPISQVTPPEEVLAFIDSHPGLADACIEHPSYMLSYAPQLALPGVAGWLQEIVDETWQWARDRVASSGVDPDGAEGRRRLLHGPSYLVLRDIEVVKVDRPLAACAWAHGELNGPPVRVYELIDYAGWLASGHAAWLGAEMRTELLAGIAEWGVWPNWEEDPLGYSPVALFEWLEDDAREAKLGQIREVLSQRLATSKRVFGLEEDSDVLADWLIAAGFVQKYRRRQAREDEPSEGSNRASPT